MAGIKDSEVSFVVQGKIGTETKLVLESIRTFFPRSQIVLSTWSGSMIDDLQFDDLVFSEDNQPNCDCYIDNPYGHSKINNINRQIITTKAGIAKATRKYIFKTRTDFEFTSSESLSLYDQMLRTYIEADEAWKIFKFRILTMGTGDASKMQLPYHLGDYIQLGLREDVEKLWDIPFMDEKVSNFCRNNNIAREPWFFNFQYTCEQWIWISNLEREHIVFHKPRIYYELNDSIERDSRKSFINNFFFIDYEALCIKSKFEWITQNSFAYNFEDFIGLFDAFCSSGVTDRRLETTNRLRGKIAEQKKLHNRYRVPFYQRLFYKARDVLCKHPRLYSLYLKHPFLKRIKVCFWGKTEAPTIEPLNRIECIDIKGNMCEVGSIPGLSICIAGKNNRVVCKSLKGITNTSLYIDGNNNYVEIGSDVHCITNTNIFMGNQYNNRKLLIGNNAMIMGARIFVEEDYGSVTIGNDLVCSDEVIIQNSDGHIILNAENSIVNRAKRGISIGDKVWIGRRAMVLKECKVENNVILGAGCVATGKVYGANSTYAGNPAKLLKTGLTFSRDMFNAVLIEDEIEL